MTPEPTTLTETCDVCTKPLTAHAVGGECRCADLYGFILLQAHRDHRTSQDPTPISIYVDNSRLDVAGGVELPSPGERFITLYDIECDDESHYDQVEIRLESISFTGFNLP